MPDVWVDRRWGGRDEDLLYRASRLRIRGTPHDQESRPKLDQLCSACSNIVRKSRLLNVWSRRHPPAADRRREEWTHVESREALTESALRGCHVCTLLDLFSGFTNANSPLRMEITYTSGFSWSEIVKYRVQWKTVENNVSHSRSWLYLLKADNGTDLKYRRTVKGSWRHSSTASEAVMKVARDWLRDCMRHHPLCNETGSLSPQRPKRILLLRRSPDGQVDMRLNERQDREWEGLQYLTLSYCWGDGQTLKLTTATLGSFRDRVPFEELPRTLQDAAEITLRLGYSALWIDALCIVQDERKDWLDQVPKMASIFGNSVCTISATIGLSNASGCFVLRRPLSYIPCKIRTRGHRSLLLTQPLASIYGDEDNPSSKLTARTGMVIETRGWVLQEQIFSPRTLYFAATGIYWQCCTACCSEFGSGQPQEGHSSKASVARIIRTPLYDSDASQLSAWRQWWSVIEDYTRRDLTVASDRWPAISALSDAWATAKGWSMICGLWKRSLKMDMLWSSKPSESSDVSTTGSLGGFPIWSWLSIVHPVQNKWPSDTAFKGRFFAELTTVEHKHERFGMPNLLSTPGNETTTFTTATIACLQIRAPLMRFRPSHELPSIPGYYAFNFVINEGNFKELETCARQSLEEWRWEPDIVLKGAQLPELAALQWAWLDSESPNKESILFALVVAPHPSGSDVWYRVGIFQMPLYDGAPGPPFLGNQTIGPYETIHLV